MKINLDGKIIEVEQCKKCGAWKRIGQKCACEKEESTPLTK